MAYVYERADWPNFRWDAAALAAKLGAVRHCQGSLLGRMAALGSEIARDASLRSTSYVLVD